MVIIIGLGNPGKEYEATRHNVGFMALDLLRDKLALANFALNKKFNALVTEGNFSGKKFLLAKPQTFMNSSGEAVSKLAAFYNIEPDQLWVIYDDVDLPLGTVRVRPGGSAGTHNGMKSIIATLGFSNFPRVRIGIESRGVDAPEKQDVASFVLHPFLKKELPIVKKSLERAAQEVLRSLGKGIEVAMDRYN